MNDFRTLAGLMLALATTAGGDFSHLSGWEIVEPPAGDNWQCANRSDDEWTVSIDPARTLAILPHEPTREVRLKLPDGELIGINQGEFGGTLEWVTPDSVREVLMPTVNPVALTTRGDDIFVASGLAHLGLDSGGIFRLRRSANGTWDISKPIDLGEAPNAGVRIDDAWFLLTTNGITKIDLSTMTQEMIYRNEKWWLLYGNSIVPLGDSWVIGARRAVIRLTPVEDGYAEDWLVPDRCRKLVGPECVCER